MAGNRLKNRLSKVTTGEKKLGFDPVGTNEGRFAQIKLSEIETDLTQPRKDMGNLEELAASIKEQGVISPIVVEPIGPKSYRIVAGERRFRASQEAGLKEIPAIVRTFEEQQRAEVQVIENLHRKDFNPIEEALAYKQLQDQFGLSQNQLAKRLGKSRVTINETLRILTLPAKIIEGCRTPDTPVSRSGLLEVSRLQTEKEQLKAFQKLKSGKSSSKMLRSSKKKSKEISSTKINIPQGIVSITLNSKSATSNDYTEALKNAILLLK